MKFVGRQVLPSTFFLSMSTFLSMATFLLMIRCLLVSSLLLVSMGLSAQEGNPEAFLRELIVKNSNNLVALLESERKYYTEDPQRFYSSMEGALDDVVDFQRFTLRVMGKYARGSTQEQRRGFLTVFKKSLFKAYSKALVESGDFKLNVLTADINSRSSSRATVGLEIVSDGSNHYPVTYAMYQDNTTKKWLVENVIVSGVNMGLAFRDRFEQQMRLHKNDIDQVIAGWTSQVDVEKLDKEK